MSNKIKVRKINFTHNKYVVVCQECKYTETGTNVSNKPVDIVDKHYKQTGHASYEVSQEYRLSFERIKIKRDLLEA